MRGPSGGSEPTVKYCPECKGDLEANKQGSHSYKCNNCGNHFEINKLN